ncbi:ELMO/CED-12 family protein isoform 1 [Cinnamomum micranthum f. kanehirae]|uniref:ELMO/CED-12 family protein isoform 1 n=1 Tax=Cinnamomum micranthum f. kanehirae TaxID=337451 RepID=A0A3S3NHA9_9MAGN|nr:ELMO/CED-12 family protein isoform 1 [Cinnamomum micranthum f. kanehirae]
MHHGQDSFQRLLHKQDEQRAEWEYPFVVAGINISFMLVQMLDLQSGRPTSVAGIRSLEQLGEDEEAFDNLFCVAFQMMDAQWLAKHASYMMFSSLQDHSWSVSFQHKGFTSIQPAEKIVVCYFNALRAKGTWACGQAVGPRRFFYDLNENKSAEKPANMSFLHVKEELKKLKHWKRRGVIAGEHHSCHWPSRLRGDSTGRSLGKS